MAQQYRERLSVPWWWWLLGLVIALTFVIAVWAFLGNTWGLAGLGVAVVLVSAAMVAWSRTTITVADGWLRAGGAQLEQRYIRSATALDQTQSQAALRQGTRDWLLVRPWLTTMVAIELDDEADPHPRWLINTAHPRALAAALQPEPEPSHG